LPQPVLKNIKSPTFLWLFYKKTLTVKNSVRSESDEIIFEEQMDRLS
jgi:hypothetical protein